MGPKTLALSRTLFAFFVLAREDLAILKKFCRVRVERFVLSRCAQDVMIAGVFFVANLLSKELIGMDCLRSGSENSKREGSTDGRSPPCNPFTLIDSNFLPSWELNRLPDLLSGWPCVNVGRKSEAIEC